MHTFILAGGFATRLWPLTESRPKPLLPLAGKPILTHLVEKIPKNVPITVSTNAVFADAFHHWKRESDAPIHILIEDTRHDDHKLGALGAVAQWITNEHIDDDVLLLTGDNYFGCSLEAFIQSARPGIPLLAAHDIGDLDRAKQFGTVIIQQANQSNNNETPYAVIAFEEKPPHPQSTLVSTGCSFLPRAALPILVEHAKSHPDNVGGIFEEFLRKKVPVDAFLFSEPWFDIGSFDAYLEATVSLVGNNVLTGERSFSKATQCSGSVVLGNRCAARNSTLHNVVLFDDCSIEDCDLRDCICDDGCTLRGIDLEKKMLRKGTTLIHKD